MRDWLITRAYIDAVERGKPCKAFESLIASDGEASYFYALRVLHGRFKEGEQSISKIPMWAVKYARFIRRRRFVMAEPHIAGDPERCYEYFRHVVGGVRLPEKMHASMVLLSFAQPENQFVRKYFKELDRERKAR